MDADVVILGGGATGVGATLRMAERGYSTILLERDTIGSATSNNSHCIIHGGFRYLKTLHLPRVLQSIRASREITQRYGSFVQPLPCLMPLTKSGLQSKWPITAAAKFYNILSQHPNDQRARALSQEATKQLAPETWELTPYGSLLWYDHLLLDHFGLMLAVLNDAKTMGAQVFERTAVVAVRREGQHFEVETDRRVYRSPAVINTLGPWIHDVSTPKMLNPIAPSWCRAFNIVLDRLLPMNQGTHQPIAVGLQSPQKRLFFFVPRNGVTAIGTGYLPHTGRPEDVQITEAEITEFLQEASSCFRPHQALTLSQMSQLESGILPSHTSQDMEIELYKSTLRRKEKRYVEILGTKYTTFLQGYENL